MKSLKLSTFVQLLIIISLLIILGNLIPQKVKEVFYSISLTLKDLVLFVLPVLVFLCIFSGIISIKGKNAARFTIFLIGIVFLSNYIAVLIAYGVALLNLVNIDISVININSNNQLLPLWHINFPKLLSNNYSILLGFGLGIIVSFFSPSFIRKINSKVKYLISFFLETCFLQLLPIFILGFILKLKVEDALIQSLKFFLPLCILIILVYVLYIAILFAIVAEFNLYLWWRYIKNTMPAVAIGFSTMSSLIAIPLTINAAEKNTNSYSLSCLVIPTTVNIHTVGLAINIPLIALSILLGFGYELPSFITYTEFAVYFVLAQFGIAAVPGCGILFMIPLLESYLGFTSDMSAFIIAIYILFDPAETSTNILGNSALVILLRKFNRYIKMNIID